MSRRDRVIILAAMIALVAWVAHAGEEVAFDKTFDVKSGGKLELDVDDMDVEIKPGKSDQARVVVTLRGNLDKAWERFEESRFDAELEGNTLVVETRKHRHTWSWSWSSGSRVGIHVAVTLPENFDVYAATSDGDIMAAGIDGEIDLKTSDGDVELDGVNGPSIYVKTSDGDIRAEELGGDDINLRTSDGDIIADHVKSEKVSLHTSDGNIKMDKLEAESISARTSDGDVRLFVTGEKLTAKSSDGDIDVKVESSMALDLSTSDGDITIRVPSGFGADLELKGERVKLGGKVTIEGEVGKRRISGVLGDGGPRVRARTSDGQVTLRFY